MKLLRNIIFLIVFFSCVFVVNTVRKKSIHEKIVNDYKELELYSVVLNKYEDSSRYHYDTIIIQNVPSRKDTILRSHYNKSDFFKVVQVGDTLVKDRGTMNLKIINSKRFKYGYNTSFIFEQF